MPVEPIVSTNSHPLGGRPGQALFRTLEYPDLPILAKVTGKGEFYSLGTGTHPVHPVTADGKPAGHLGTGAYALDQSFHVFFLFLAALLIAAL